MNFGVLGNESKLILKPDLTDNKSVVNSKSLS